MIHIKDSNANSFHPEKIKVEQLSYPKVNTVVEYLNSIEAIHKKFWGETRIMDTLQYSSKIWYRGVKDKDYPMVPSIARKGLDVGYETIFLSRFKSKAIPYLGQLPSFPLSDKFGGYWDWLFLMQQYGVPTRLMDWSEDALVALLFSCDSKCNKNETEKDSAVWCLNPVKLNEAFQFNDLYPPGYIPNVEEKEFYNLFGPEKLGIVNEKPCSVYGPLNSTRIVAQKGVFTVFPYIKNLKSISQLPDSSEYLERIVISKDARSDIIEQLRRYGINYAQLFPEIGYIAAEIFEEGY